MENGPVLILTLGCTKRSPFKTPVGRSFLLQPNNQGFDTRECEICEIYWNFHYHWSGPTISEHDATPGWKCIWEEVMENVEFLGRHCSCVGSWTTIFRSTIFCKCDVHSWKCVVKYWPYLYAPSMEYWRFAVPQEQNNVDNIRICSEKKKYLSTCTTQTDGINVGQRFSTLMELIWILSLINWMLATGACKSKSKGKPA